MGKAKYIIGAIFGAGTLAFLVSRIAAKRLEEKAEVLITTNPLNMTVLVDDKYEVVTPSKIYLTPGEHKFAVSARAPNLQLLFLFDRWELNGQPASYSNTAIIRISGKATLVAQYELAESGIYPILPTPA